MHLWKRPKKTVEHKAKIDAKIQLKQAKLDEKKLLKENKEIVKMQLKKEEKEKKMQLKEEEKEKKMKAKKQYQIKLKKDTKDYKYYTKKMDNDFMLCVHNTFAWYEKFDLKNDKTMRYSQERLNRIKELAISNLLEESLKTLATKRSAAEWLQDEKKKKP